MLDGEIKNICLCCLMTPGLSENTGYAYTLSLVFCACTSPDQTFRAQVTWTVRLVIANGHFNLPRRFVWLCMGSDIFILSPLRVGGKILNLLPIVCLLVTYCSATSTCLFLTLHQDHHLFCTMSASLGHAKSFVGQVKP